MATHVIDIYKMSRRALLQAGGCAVAGATLAASAGSALAKAKRSQADVAYVDHPKGSEKCDNCEPFIPPNACKTVSGTVSANGWCKIYVAK
jgi:hypothetical protein